MHRNPLAALLALPLLLAGALLPSEAGAAPGKPGKPEVIPFVTGGGNFNVYFLVKWTPSNPKPNSIYEINSGEGSIGADYPKDATQVKLMPKAPETNLIRNGLTLAIKVRGMDNNSGSSVYGPWSDSTSVRSVSATVDHSNVTSNGATLTVTNLPATWWYKGDQDGAQCTKVNNGTSTVNITGLTPGTEYTYSIYYRDTCTEDSDKAAHWDVKATFTTPATTPAKPTGLTASGGNGTVTLSWNAGNNGGSAITGWKYIKKAGNTWDTNWTPVPNSGASTTSYTVPNLINGTSYKFKVRAVNTNGDGVESDESATVTLAPVHASVPSKPTVVYLAEQDGRFQFWWQSQSNLTATEVHYKHTDGSFENTVRQASFNHNTVTYTVSNGTRVKFRIRFKNTSGFGPWSEFIDGVTGPEVLAASNITHNSATLTLSKYEGWGHPTHASREARSDWSYKHTSPPGTCNDVARTEGTQVAGGGIAVDVTGLTPDKSYTFAAYSGRDCSTLLATATAFTTPAATPPAPSKPSVAAGNASVTLSGSSVASTGASTITKWEYAYKSKPSGGSYGNYGSWKDVTGTSTTMPNTTVTSLTNGTEYTFKVRAVNSNGNGADSPESNAVTPAVTATLTTPANASQSVTAGAGDAKLTASNVTHNAATLIIGNHNGDWYYKTTAPTIGICSASAVATASLDLADLAGNTSYTFKAYSNSGCTTELAAAAAFLTKPAKPAKPTVTAGAGNGKLTLASSVTGGSGALSNWEYSTDDGTTWTTINVTSTTLSYVVTGLTDGTDYTFKVRATNTTGAGPTSDASDPATPRGKATLTVSSVTHHSATLTIGNHTGDWYYKATTPTSGVCSATAVATASLDLADLAGNTSYTFTAYSDSNCATELATASAFLTKPAKPSKPTVTAGAGRDTLTLSASVTGDGTLTKWQYTTDDGANWSDINVTATTLNHTVTDLTGWTDYTFKVRAVNATGTGPASDASAPATSSAVDSPKVDVDSPRLDDVILPKVVGQVTAATTTAITTRLDAIAAGAAASSRLQDVATASLQFLQSQGQALNRGRLQWEEALSGRSFALPLPLPGLSLADAVADTDNNGASAPGPIVLWGNGDYTSYRNGIDGIDFEGNTFSAHLGFDLQPRADLVTGVALASSNSTFDYTDTTQPGTLGTYAVRITSVNPYLSYAASRQLRLWASAGYGRGEGEINPQGDAAVIDHGPWTSLVGGARFQFWSADTPSPGDNSPFSLALKADAGTAHFLDVAVQQARLAAEASRSFALASGELTTAMELGLRLASEAAAAVELAGRLHWQDHATGFSTTLNGRLLLDGGDEQEWGLGGGISYGPSNQGTGLSVVLETSLGDTASTLAQLWSMEDLALSLPGKATGAALRAEVGYGFPMGSALLTPYSDVSLSDAGRTSLGLGLRYGWTARLDLDLKVEQQRSSNGSVDHRVDLQLHTPL